MAYLEKLIINGASYFLADKELREAREEMEAVNAQLQENVSALQQAQTGSDAADARQDAHIARLQAMLDAMKIADTAAGESLHLQGSMEDVLRDLRVYVSASQAGEGTPSATNIRPISPAIDTVTVGVADNAAMDGAVSYEAALPAGMYGGYYDWERGVFVQTHDYVVVDGTKGIFNQNGAGVFYTSAVPVERQSQTTAGALQDTGMCDSVVYGKDKAEKVVYCSMTTVWFRGFGDCANAAAFKAYLREHPVHIVYPLQTPIEHVIANAPALEAKTLHPETFLDTTGDKLEVTYVISPQAYVDKKIKEALGENV